IDLRGNGGGFMESAILMVNEFLPENQLIVFTKGREKKNDSQVWSDGNGSFKDVELIVLIDEYSASASEIFAGAIQDNDRGLVIGRRSFGKGLVQRQISLPDSSAIRLTVARYYTPSGRCIQKDFKPGEDSAYGQELINRYSHGELYSRDSIKIDQSKIFETSTGRIVYGGGGIIPDIFVPSDTTGITSYYVNIVNAGLLQKFAFQYTDINREAFKKMKDYKQFLRVLPSDEALLGDFAIYASQNGVPARWYYINLSRNLLVTQLKALIARDVFGNEAFYPIFNKHDRNIEMAIKAFNKHKATFPILKAEDK
ncbi:MAG: S41 family peptidase, partial [Muribaculaceae bacterium]